MIMKVYTVWKEYRDFSWAVTDNELHRYRIPGKKLLGIFETEAQAREVQEKECYVGIPGGYLETTPYDVVIESDIVESDPSCFCTERWYDDDLIAALEATGIGADTSDEAVANFRQEVQHIFDDKTIRNEMLVEAANWFLEKRQKEAI